jgi:replicative DNA helicase
VGAFLDKFEGAAAVAAERRTRRGPVPIQQLAVEVAEDIQQRHTLATEITGVPTGLSDLDRVLAGFQPCDFILLAGRPSMGKTAFALHGVRHAGIEARIPTLVFSLEMSKKQLAERMINAEGKLDGNRVRTGQLRRDDWLRLTESTGRVGSGLIHIDDDSEHTLGTIRSVARRWRRDRAIFPNGDADLGLIVIDYLQLIVADDPDADDNRALTLISKGLKRLAKALHVPVIALSQLNRSVEKRDDKRPMLSDLRGSGSLEQDADVIMFMHRPNAKKGLDAEGENLAEVIVGKQRNGPCSTVDLFFMKECGRFELRAPPSRYTQPPLPYDGGDHGNLDN